MVLLLFYALFFRNFPVYLPIMFYLCYNKYNIIGGLFAWIRQGRTSVSWR